MQTIATAAKPHELCASAPSAACEFGQRPASAARTRSFGAQKAAGMSGPARGYSWRAFEKNNTASMTHGARSDRLVEPRAAELVPMILEANGHLDPVRDGPALHRYAMCLARVERCY